VTAVMSSCCPTSTEEVLTLPIPSPQTPDLQAVRAQGRQFVLSTIDRKQTVVDTETDASPEIRVLIADRDPMSGDLLAHALAGRGICEAHAVNSADLLKTLEARPTDVAVIASDLTLGPRNAFDLAHAVNRSYPNVQIVMILNQSDPDTVMNAFRSGARGVFSRTQPMLEFLDCVQHVHKGYLWAGGQEAVYLLDIIRNLPALSPLTAINCPSLTERELQVVRLAATGKTNRAIAAELSLSEHTVKNYLFRSFEKLGVSTRVELLFYLTMRGHSFSPAGADAR
jgi:two-component system nitrate/nitrite response regulator NarL